MAGGSTGKHVLCDLTYQKPQARQNGTLYCLWIPKCEANYKGKQGEEEQHGQAHSQWEGNRETGMAVEGLRRAAGGTPQVTTTYSFSRTGW